MQKRSYYRRKRIIIAYGMRLLIIVICVLILLLLVCGCIYIFDLFQEKHIGITQGRNIQTYSFLQTEMRVAVPDTPVSEIDRMVVVLDAGHGGKDTGALSGNIYEKDITIAVVQRMKRRLEEKGFQVVLTREDDCFVTLEERTQIANDAEADLFVSIHCNYYEGDAGISGLECYYQEDSVMGKNLAEEIVSGLSDNGEIEVRSAKPENYFVLRNTEALAVLVELGFLSNKAECKKLTQTEYQEQLANNLVEYIAQVL